MGACNCLGSNAIITEINANPQKAKEITLKFRQNERLIFILKRVQARLRGIIVRNQIKVRAIKRPRETVGNYNEKIQDEDLNQLCRSYPPLSNNDNVRVVMKNPIEDENKGVYYGEWNADTNQKHGRGIQVWVDGSRYEGYWVNNKANFKGKLIHSDGDFYEGEWLNDKAHGYGIYRHVDGAQYEGNWKDDKQEGKGIEKWPDGSCYEGNYHAGKKSGLGYFKWVDGSNYKGNFENNQINGKGTYIWKDRRKFEGHWVNNKMEGKGEFIWPDNRKYNGEYKNDKKEGYGVFIWSDGRIYKGSWRGGKQHDQGEFFNPKTNEWKRGIWENGKRIKWIDDPTLNQ